MATDIEHSAFASKQHMRDKRVNRSAVTVSAIFGLMLIGSVICAQDNPDETAIRRILDNEVATWNQGDTDGYSRAFAADGTFTNIRGMFFTGHQEFRDRHEAIFKGEFRGTSLKQELVSLRFIRPDVAIAETRSLTQAFRSAGARPSRAALVSATHDGEEDGDYGDWTKFEN